MVPRLTATVTDVVNDRTSRITSAPAGSARASAAGSAQPKRTPAESWAKGGPPLTVAQAASARSVAGWLAR
jgi:hypothetical protein